MEAKKNEWKMPANIWISFCSFLFLAQERSKDRFRWKAMELPVGGWLGLMISFWKGNFEIEFQTYLSLKRLGRLGWQDERSLVVRLVDWYLQLTMKESLTNKPKLSSMMPTFLKSVEASQVCSCIPKSLQQLKQFVSSITSNVTKQPPIFY